MNTINSNNFSCNALNDLKKTPVCNTNNSVFFCEKNLPIPACEVTKSENNTFTSVSLHDAKKIKEIINEKDLEHIQKVMTKDIILNMGYLLLEWAMETKDEAIVLFFLKQGAPISQTAAEQAIERGWTFVVETYINTHPIPSTFLEKALQSKKDAIIELLIDRNAPDDNCGVMIDAICYSQKWIKRLLEKGYQLNVGAIINANTPEDASILLEYGAPINEDTLTYAAENGWDDILKTLIDKGVNIPPQALNKASSQGHVSTVDLLIKHGAPIGEDLIKNAIRSNNIALIYKLLDYGAKIGKQCLRVAIIVKNREIIDFLLANGAPLDEVDVDTAIICNNEALVRELIAKGAPLGKQSLRVTSDCSESLFNYLLSITKKIPKNTLNSICCNRSSQQALIRAKALVEKGAFLDPEALTNCLRRGHKKVFNYLMSLNISTEKLNFSEALRLKQYHMMDLLSSFPQIPIDANIFQYAIPKDVKHTLIAEIQKRILQNFNQTDPRLISFEKIQTIIDILSSEEEKFSFDTGSNIIPIFQDILIASRHVEMPLDKIILFITKPSDFNWKLIYPHFNVPTVLTKYSPWGFNPVVYEDILPITQEACQKEGNTGAEINAYKLTVLFDSKQKATDYLAQAKKTNQPVHDACLFELPKQGLWNIEYWRSFAEKNKYAIDKMQLIALAPEIESRINSFLTPYAIVKDKATDMVKYYRREILECMKVHPHYKEKIPKRSNKKQIRRLMWEAIGELLPKEKEFFLNRKKDLKNEQLLVEFLNWMVTFRNLKNKTYKDLISIVVHWVYGNVEEQYKQAAYEFVKGGISKKHFDEAISILKEKPKTLCYIPSVHLEGSLIQQPNFIFETMSSTDPLMFILGKKTSCCQSIDGHSRDCVLHGATQPYGAFVRIMKPESSDPWVAQSWVGLTENNEVVFDSIEHNTGHDPETILKLYALAATSMLIQNPHIKCVLFGGGGNTPKKHPYPLQPKPPQGYSRIIGYKEIGYDSKDKRFILATQQSLDPVYVELVKHIESTPNTMTQDGFLLTKGTDTYVKVNQEIQGLSLNTIDRYHFFEKHPKTEALLRKTKLNPLVEEGFYSQKERERVGEYFLNFEAIQKLIEVKFHNKAHYKATHRLLIDNDPNELLLQLKNISLAEAENILIGYIEGVHASSAYIEKVNGQLKCVIVDPEHPSDHSVLSKCIRSAFTDIDIQITKEQLQVDYYSCSTFLIKSFLYFAKHGKNLFQEKTPAALLKMAQKVNFNDLSPETKNEIVSFKQGLTLAQYIQQHQATFKGKTYNLAALRKKYRYYDQLEKVL